MADNVQKQAQLMGVIAQNQAAYKQAFGYNEWRAACEVLRRPMPILSIFMSGMRWI